MVEWCSKETEHGDEQTFGPACWCGYPRAKGARPATTGGAAARRTATRHAPDVELRLLPLRSFATYPTFRGPGSFFKDITPMLADPRAFHIVLDSLAERFIGEHVDAVVGVDARGFIFGGALAARLNASFVPARKPGKLRQTSTA